MTRAKAIEAAMARLREKAEHSAVRDERGELLHEGHPRPLEVYDEMEAMWEQGRISGLREAARIAKWWDGETASLKAIQGRANALAKKARGK